MKKIKLIPHKDIINNIPSVLIIGYGWVGQFIGKYFNDACYVDVDNKIKSVKTGTVTKKNKFEYGFICVPTPMKNSGQCDISYVEGVIKKWHTKIKYFCIKSTVEIGTTEYLEKKYNVNICFSPEYLGETVAHPMNETKKNTFIILGGNPEITNKFAELWTFVTNSYTKIYQVPARTAELCKLMENSWIATKVTFCNEFFDLAKKTGTDWHELREIWLADPRISRSHTWVFEKNRGFSGKCLPKDINNLVYYFGSNAELMSFILKKNKK